MEVGIEIPIGIAEEVAMATVIDEKIESTDMAVVVVIHQDREIMNEETVADIMIDEIDMIPNVVIEEQVEIIETVMVMTVRLPVMDEQIRRTISMIGIPQEQVVVNHKRHGMARKKRKMISLGPAYTSLICRKMSPQMNFRRFLAV